MTREKAIEIISCHKILVDEDKSGLLDKKLEYEAIDMAIKALKQEPKAHQFTNWVAEKIFGGACEDEAFAEICCRKLAKLGIVKANGDEWELVEPMKSEEKQ